MSQLDTELLVVAAALRAVPLDRMATSQLAVLTEEEYQRGISRVWREIEACEARGEELELVFDLWLYATIGWDVS